MEYISAEETARKWNVSGQRVRVFCREGRIPGMIKVGKSYMIPADAKKPEDPRRIRKQSGKHNGSDERTGQSTEKSADQQMERIHPDDRVEFTLLLDRILETGKEQQQDFRVWNPETKAYTCVHMTGRL